MNMGPKLATLSLTFGPTTFDFGSKLIKFLTHQIFFSSRSVAHLCYTSGIRYQGHVDIKSQVKHKKKLFVS